MKNRVRNAFVWLSALSMGAGPALAEEPLTDVVRSLEGRSNAERVQIAGELLEEAGLEPELQSFEHPRGETTVPGSNVRLRVEGSEPDLGLVVVGAHIDAAPLREGGFSPGASDNASGSSVVLHLARRLAEHPFRHSVEFVLFDLEELGFVGSRHYVAELGSKPVAMINVDIGTTGTTIAYGPSSAPGNESLYEVAGELCRTAAECMPFPNYPPSDERSFQAAGVPNISFAVLPKVEAHQLWLRLNGGADSGLEDGFLPATARRIHTADDTSEHVSEEALAELTGYLERFLVVLDDRLD